MLKQASTTGEPEGDCAPMRTRESSGLITVSRMRVPFHFAESGKILLNNSDLWISWGRGKYVRDVVLWDKLYQSGTPWESVGVWRAAEACPLLC